jgi:hypothetical protein
VLIGIIAAGLAAVAGAGTARDGAGNRIEPLQPFSGQSVYALHCTSDRHWCVRLGEDEAHRHWSLYIFPGVPGEGGGGVRYVPSGQEDGDPVFEVWPHIVIQAHDGVIVGVTRTDRTGYSGGGASVARLELVRVGDGAANAILQVPIAGQADLRACFSDSDRRARHDACSDRYEFNGTLELDASTRAGFPSFILTTRARTYPGHVSRSRDSSGDQLRPSDLHWSDDPVCSYRRSFHLVPPARRYEPDAPLPDCSDFLDL